MSQLTQTPLSSPARQKPAMNPFARALADAEREKQGSSSFPQASDDSTNLFGDALARAGSGTQDFQNPSQDWMVEQQRQAEEQRKKEVLRRRLHDQVNPVDAVDVFSAREKQVKQEIDQLRNELKGLVRDVGSFNKEVELTLMTEVSNPGMDGAYYLTFFQKLRSFIMLLRQKLSSAKTWATQLQAKNTKKKQRGMTIGGLQHEKTSTIQDMMHHERSSQYSGG